MHIKRTFSFYRLFYYLPILLYFLITSCIPQKRILLLQDKAKTNPREFSQSVPFHKIQPGDELYVKVIGLDAKTYAFFNGLPYSETGGTTSGLTAQQGISSIYISSYTVNDSGYIQFPMINKLMVKNMLIDDAQRLLQDSITKYANYAVVLLKYVNFNVTVLGEVTKPGTVVVDNDQISLFQAIGKAGDLTEYANRNTVTVMRKTASGTKLISIDLTDRSVFESEAYYLMPDDIVYIAPMGAKAFGLKNFQLGTFLSLVSTVLILYSLIK